jgi:hypothetical protein
MLSTFPSHFIEISTILFYIIQNYQLNDDQHLNSISSLKLLEQNVSNILPQIFQNSPKAHFSVIFGNNDINKEKCYYYYL